MKSRSDEPAVRPLTPADRHDLVSLYDALTLGPKTARPKQIAEIMAHPGTSVFGAEVDARVVAMATLHVLPNATFGGRPYALIENVATEQAFRLRGLGRHVMQAAINTAWDQNAYKIMLMTGQKRGAQGFYQALGFDSEDKFAMVLRRP
ncbi:hypothetical protein ROLI_023520 [Roseobacter fucihabitans]|uniref:N-acetyltransferase domain-containing protein n=1 Tax=Roseobacter fucihabitans TaxID=1537242 RepID=A0ABZ2BTG8_9RHOB|nr:GNAT family N-acetyltransferase [Roseobacter litoralis]MBC6965764.1 putative acetyltransferase [Roseobacter litoralis]